MVKVVAALLIPALLVGCAPGLDKTLDVGRIAVDEPAADPRGMWAPLKVRIESVRDLRKESAIGEINGRALEPSSDVAASVQRALEQKLKASGVRVALFDGVPLEIEVNKWFVTVRPAFPTSAVEAEAELNFKLLNSRNQLLYQGKYSGSAVAENPFTSQTKVEEILGLAMSEALDQALDDSRLLDRIGSSVAPVTGEDKRRF